MITSINFTQDFQDFVIPLSLHKTIKMMEVKKKRYLRKLEGKMLMYLTQSVAFSMI